MRLGLGLLLWVGCGRQGSEVGTSDRNDTDAGPDTDRGGDTDTGTDGAVGALDASCVLAEDNALRAICRATFATPATLEITLTLGSEEERIFTAGAPATSVELPVWGLIPNTSWGWRATAVEDRGAFASGTIVAGPLGGALQGMSVSVQASGSYGPEHVLLNYGCLGFTEAVLVLDRLGRVRWYQDAESAPIVPAALTFRSINTSPHGGVLALLERRGVVHWGFDGAVRMSSDRFEQFDPPVHHEVVQTEGWTYVLFAEETVVDGVAYVTDGFLVLDPSGEVVATWRMADHLAPVGEGGSGGGYWGDLYPDALDWSHSNALAVDDGLDVTVSLRFQDALVRVRGDPLSPDFGLLDWVVASEGSGLASTLPYFSSAGIVDLAFHEQHHVVASAPGELTLWDNGNDIAVGSRVLRFVETAGGLDLVQTWPAGVYCPGQGSATVLPSGNVMVDCAPRDTIFEIDPAGVTVWSAEVTCNPGLMLRPLYRALPIALFPDAP